MTVVELKGVLPRNLQGAASQELVNKINDAAQDPEIAELIKENFISYTKVLAEGKFKPGDYLNAVAYVSYKLMGYNNQDAYAKTFPVRWQRHALLGTSSKDISAYVAAYNKNKLVNLILEQSLIPSWVLNQDAYQKAINVQMELMTSANSEKVRCDAANSLLTHIKPPEVKKVELSVGLNEHAGLGDLRASMAALAQQQLELIQGGAGARHIARAPLILEHQAQDIINVPSQPEPQPVPLAAPAVPLLPSEPTPSATAAQPPASTQGSAASGSPTRRPSLFDPLP